MAVIGAVEFKTVTLWDCTSGLFKPFVRLTSNTFYYYAVTQTVVWNPITRIEFPTVAQDPCCVLTSIQK